MSLYGSVLSLSEVEKPIFSVIYSRCHPLVVLYVILNFICLVSLAVDHKKNILEVFSQNLLVLILLEKCIKVVKILILFSRHIGLQETHRMHQCSYMVEV